MRGVLANGVRAGLLSNVTTERCARRAAGQAPHRSSSLGMAMVMVPSTATLLPLSPDTRSATVRAAPPAPALGSTGDPSCPASAAAVSAGAPAPWGHSLFLPLPFGGGVGAGEPPGGAGESAPGGDIARLGLLRAAAGDGGAAAAAAAAMASLSGASTGALSAPPAAPAPGQLTDPGAICSLICASAQRTSIYHS
jgi:hypothetical protein